MAYYAALEGFEFHDKITVGSYQYFVFENKHGQRLIRRMELTTDSTRYCLTLDSIATILASPASYEYRSLSGWTW